MALILPPLPANHPSTPAVMFWRWAPAPGLIHQPAVYLLHRREDPCFRACVDSRTSISPRFLTRDRSLAALGLFMDDSEPSGEWVRVGFRAIDTKVRFAAFSSEAIMYGLKHNRIQAITAPLCEFSRTSTNPPTAWRGRRIVGATNFKEAKELYARWKPLIVEALKAKKEGSYREERDAIDECINYTNEDLGQSYRARFVDALETAFDANNEESGVRLADCGHTEHVDDMVHDHDNTSYCDSCRQDLREIDGDYYNEDDCYYWESDGEYHTESEPEDEDEYYNEDEDSRDSHLLLRSWGASVSGLSHTTFAQDTFSDFTMGVELEVECESGRQFDSALESCNDHFNSDYRYAMFKKDGSLSDQGFEIVTAARKLPDHISMFKEWVPHDTLRAWKPGNCGVHVHIDSRAFSPMTLGKFMMFINSDQNVGLITAIAGRHPKNDSKARSYCAQIGQEVLGDPLKVLKGNNHTRYRMVNLTNLGYDERDRLQVTDVSRECKGDYSTVELRIFRASLKKERLLAQIEFTHAAVMFCRTASWHGLSGDDFKAWLATGATLQYKNLARWFGLRVPKVDKRPTAPVVRQELEAECA